MLNFKKKAVVVTTAAIGAVAVGTGAWAYVTITGSGTGTASASAAAQAELKLSATSTIEDLDTPADVVVTAKSDKNNRRINGLTVSLDSVPAGCKASWFKLSNGTDENTGVDAVAATETADATLSVGAKISTSGWAGQTLVKKGEEATLTGTKIKITMIGVDAAQDACINQPLTLTVKAV